MCVSIREGVLLLRGGDYILTLPYSYKHVAKRGQMNKKTYYITLPYVYTCVCVYIYIYTHTQIYVYRDMYREREIAIDRYMIV